MMQEKEQKNKKGRPDGQSGIGRCAMGYWLEVKGEMRKAKGEVRTLQSAYRSVMSERISSGWLTI